MNNYVKIVFLFQNINIIPKTTVQEKKNKE